MALQSNIDRRIVGIHGTVSQDQSECATTFCECGVVVVVVREFNINMQEVLEEKDEESQLSHSHIRTYTLECLSFNMMGG